MKLSDEDWKFFLSSQLKVNLHTVSCILKLMKLSPDGYLSESEKKKIFNEGMNSLETLVEAQNELAKRLASKVEGE